MQLMVTKVATRLLYGEYSPKMSSMKYIGGKSMNSLIKKGIVVAVIFLFIGLAFAPNISGNEYLFKSKHFPKNQQTTERATIYYGNWNISFRKEHILTGGVHISLHGASAPFLFFNASLDELVLEIVMNYTVEMNYTILFAFAPIVAFGIKIYNYTDYCWESIKLKNHGYFKRAGNYSVEVCLDLTNVGSGDELTLYANNSIITVPYCFTPKFNEFRVLWEYLLRFAYNLPFANKLLLHNWLLPILAPYNDLFSGLPIRLFFD